MATLSFLFAALALLLTAGPSNTLMLLSGARAGWRRTVRLIPFELTAYLIVVPTSALMGAHAASWPELAQVIKLGAAAWVLYLACALWSPRRDDSAMIDLVTPNRVFLTTLLNPKGAIAGLVLLPSPTTPAFGFHMLLFAGLVLVAAALWGGIGAHAGRVDGPWLRRAAASWLGLLSGGLALGAMPH